MTDTPSTDAIDATPIRDRDDWSRQLQAIAKQPLSRCPLFPRLAERFEAWWHQQIVDRPLFVGISYHDLSKGSTRGVELLDQPDRWLEAKRADLDNTHHVGEALPAVRVDFGPVMLGGLLGAPTEFRSDTTWTHAFIDDDWSNAPDWRLREDEAWWPLLQQLTAMVAEDARGDYLLRTPDLGGSGDVLLNMRGSTNLAMDVLDKPERIVAALDAIYPVWRRVLATLYETTLSRGAGINHWLGVWSNVPYMIPACDFNALIGPDDFRELLLPDIARQAAEVGRAVFHLDGPDAARHIDALLEVDAIQAIQFTPGAGTPSALPWIDMFRKIQAAGRSVYAMTPIEEVMTLADALPPEGLAVVTFAETPAEIDGVFEQYCRKYGVAPEA